MYIACEGGAQQSSSLQRLQLDDKRREHTEAVGAGSYDRSSTSPSNQITSHVSNLHQPEGFFQEYSFVIMNSLSVGKY